MRRSMLQCTQTHCIPRKGCFMGLVVFCILATIVLILFDHTLTCKLRSEHLEETVAVLRTRLKFLKSQYQGKQQDYAEAQAKFDYGCKTPQLVTGIDVPNTTFSPEISALLKNMSGSRVLGGILSSDKPELMKAPFSLRIMPHLLDHPDSLRPAYQMKSPRKYADYIIGVPHVRRDRETYLYDTMKDLLQKMTPEDKNSTMIVVMIGETNLTYVIETAHKIEQNFPRDIDDGIIEVISPSKHYYPDLDALPQTLGDSMKRVKWRTKQNLDAIFLMAFAQSRCLYYLMIEDDVLAEDNYMTKIREYTTEVSVTNPDWIFIQYSTTGGIGKLFRTTDLIHFMTYVQLFYNNMPIDWLTESYLSDRNCGINKGAKECAAAKTKIRPTYKKNLFKHVGLYSSLKGKIQKVKGSAAPGKRLSEYFPHKNPEVSNIKCDLEHHENFTIENAYQGFTYFWGKIPKKDNVIEFWFKNPGKFDRYLIRSANLKHVNDKISNAVFEILPEANAQNGSFVTIDTFDEFGMVEGHVDSNKYGNLYAMRIRFLAPSKYWVTITEIEFVYLEDKTAADETA